MRTQPVRRAGRVGSGCLAAVGALVVVLGAPAGARAQEDPAGAAVPPETGIVRQIDRDLVSATGEGLVRTVPDRARVVLTAESRDRDPSAAQEKNAAVMTTVQERLESLGVPPEAIQTRSLDLQPHYDYHEGRRIFRAYVARNSIEVRLDDIARVGEIVDAAVKAGATEVTSIQFDLQQRAAVEREALALAVEDAQARAEAMAAAAGRTIERIVRLDDQIRPVMPPPRQMLAVAAREDMAAAPMTPVQPGELEVQARVSLVATLK